MEGHGVNLALFDPVKIDTGVQKVEWIEYRPISQVTSGSVIEFQIPGTGQNYIDLQKTELYITARIVKKQMVLY